MSTPTSNSASYIRDRMLIKATDMPSGVKIKKVQERLNIGFKPDNKARETTVQQIRREVAERKAAAQARVVSEDTGPSVTGDDPHEAQGLVGDVYLDPSALFSDFHTAPVAPGAFQFDTAANFPFEYSDGYIDMHATWSTLSSDMNAAAATALPRHTAITSPSTTLRTDTSPSGSSQLRSVDTSGHPSPFDISAASPPLNARSDIVQHVASLQDVLPLPADPVHHSKVQQDARFNFSSVLPALPAHVQDVMSLQKEKLKPGENASQAAAMYEGYQAGIAMARLQNERVQTGIAAYQALALAKYAHVQAYIAAHANGYPDLVSDTLFDPMGLELLDFSELQPLLQSFLAP